MKQIARVHKKQNFRPSETKFEQTEKKKNHDYWQNKNF